LILLLGISFVNGLVAWNLFFPCRLGADNNDKRKAQAHNNASHEDKQASANCNPNISQIRCLLCLDNLVFNWHYLLDLFLFRT
jgi:hypothetical protein